DMARPTDSNEQLLCSFCGKSQRQVKKLIAGPGVYICDECIDLCNEIIDEELSAPPAFDIETLPNPGERTGRAPGGEGWRGVCFPVRRAPGLQFGQGSIALQSDLCTGALGARRPSTSRTCPSRAR